MILKKKKKCFYPCNKKTMRSKTTLDPTVVYCIEKNKYISKIFTKISSFGFHKKKKVSHTGLEQHKDGRVVTYLIFIRKANNSYNMSPSPHTIF